MSHATSIRRSWAIQRSVIGALLMREVLTRYGRHNIGFLWLFLEPMLFTIGVTALWTLGGLHHSSGIPIVAFALTGYSCVLLWRNMPSRLIGSVQPNTSLMYHRNVKVIDIYLARLLLEIAGATMSFIVLGLLFWSTGWLQPPEDALTVIGGWLLLAWFGSSLAIFLGALSEKSEIIDRIWHPAAYLLFPLSGAATLVDALPTSLQQVVLLFPMVHGAEIIREGYFGSRVHSYYDVEYVAFSCSILMLAGLAIARDVSKTISTQ